MTEVSAINFDVCFLLGKALILNLHVTLYEVDIEPDVVISKNQ